MDIKNYIQTLPINIYTKDNIEYTTKINENENTTFIDFKTNAINIGLRTFDNLNEVTEESVRSLFYHEVSHAILSDINIPNRIFLADINKEELHTVINIIEDERIETILKDYYHKVNFKKLIHQVASEDNSSALGTFFTALRLHKNKYTQEALKRLNGLLKANVVAKDYMPLVKLYLEIRKNNENQDNKNQEGQQDNEENKSQAIQQGDQQNNKSENTEEQEAPANLTKEQIEDIIKESLEKNRKLAGLRENNKENDEINKFLDNKFNIDSLIQKIALKAKNKSMIEGKKQRAGYINTGVFDINSLTNMKESQYKLFKNNGGKDNSNQINTINFFIDSSGSFEDNENDVNSLLEKLESLENKFSGFKFNLVTIRHNEEKLIKDKRKIHCYGGTSISHNLKDIYKSLNNNTNNYNILLIDGYTDVEGDLKYFDNKNTYICVDDSNREHFSNFIKANVTLVSSCYSYVPKLKQFIAKSLNNIACAI